jgi:hypothetical protein
MTIGRVARLAVALALIGSGASAQTYQILIGKLSGPEPGQQQELTGHFSVFPGSRFSVSADGGQTVVNVYTLSVGDFALQAGDRSFAQEPPVQFEGLSSHYVVPFDEIDLVGNDVIAVKIRGGGELIGSTADEVTFRFFEFRSDPGDAGRGVGQLDEAGWAVPRRLHLAGTLYEVDQPYRIARTCDFRTPGLIASDTGAGGDITLTAHGASAGTATGDTHAGGAIRIVIVQPPCGLWPEDPAAERPLGRFELVATAAHPIPIDVRPGQVSNLVLPGAEGLVAAAILGARSLEVCPIYDRSLRLGDGEAEPVPWAGRELTGERDVDGDGAPDLLARFRVRDTGIAFGDALICLVAQTTCGHVLEGCDGIRTLPGR